MPNVRLPKPGDEVFHDNGAQTGGADFINPPVTQRQAATILKALLENPPTQAVPWTALQQQQALYLVLLAEFRDFKSGTVY